MLRFSYYGNHLMRRFPEKLVFFVLLCAHTVTKTQDIPVIINNQSDYAITVELVNNRGVQQTYLVNARKLLVQKLASLKTVKFVPHQADHFEEVSFKVCKAEKFHYFAIKETRSIFCCQCLEVNQLDIREHHY